MPPKPRFTASMVSDRNCARVFLEYLGSQWRSGKAIGYLSPDEADAFADEIKAAANMARLAAQEAANGK
jgi:hypothetical protein